MKKAIGAALIVGGAILIYFGWNEYTSLGSEISEAITGSPSDNAVLYLSGGAAAAVAGLFLLFSGRKRRRRCF